MSVNSNGKIRLSSIRLCVFMNLLMLSSGISYANEAQLMAIEFDPAFLNSSSNNSIDLSRFQKSGQLSPGVYPLDVYKNGVWIAKENVSIVDENGASKVCLNSAIVSSLDIDWTALGKTEQDIPVDKIGCADIFSVIPNFKVTLSSANLSMDLSIPQLYLNKTSVGYISPENWSSGLNAGFVNYRLNVYRSTNKNSGTYSSFFGSINAGLNIGEWRLRHNGAYSDSNAAGAKGTYKSQSTYLQRDVTPLLSRLTLGEYYTQGNIFENVPYLGAEIRSDERMLPESLTGFAPVVTGVADSNARVTIYQNNQQVYETTVSPGPFSIDDLYNTGYNGDLTVVITESDGRVKRFKVAYSNMVQLLRPGMHRYSVAAGRYNNSSYSEKPSFIEATYQRGVNNLMTAYTGLRFAKDYNSQVLGLAFNTSFGAIAGDVTFSNASNLPASWLNQGGSSSGQSYRITMNKLITETNTNLVLAAYRYSNKGYLGFDDFVRAKNTYGWDIFNGGSTSFAGVYPQREKFQVHLNQQVSDYGSLYVSGLTETYWDKDRKRSSNYQLGYVHRFRSGTSMQLSYNHYENSLNPNQLSLSLSVPLNYDKVDTLGLTATRDADNNNTFSANVSGYLDDARSTVYGLYADVQSGAGNNSSGASIQHNARYADLTAGISTNYNGGSQMNASVNGSFLIHGNGVNFSKPLGDTFGLVHAPGAGGAQINGNETNLVASNGYGVVNNLTPYRRNNVWLTSEGVSDDVEISGNAIYVAPTAGAIVPLEFKTKTGRAVLLQVVNENNERPPLGAQVLDVDTGNSLALVGQGGYIYFRGIENTINMKIEWNSPGGKHCYFVFNPIIDSSEKYSPYDQQKLTCSHRNG